MDAAIIGLGNPGATYKNNRHNVGFRAAEVIVEHNSAASFKKIVDLAEIASFDINNEKIVVAKPLTFMNLSGRAVRFLADFYKIPAEKVFVIHDDADIAFGRVKIKQGGGNGGHNGLKSIDSLIGVNYWRIRIGVGRPPENWDLASYVLGNFSKDEDSVLRDIFDEISRNIATLLSDPKKLESMLAAKQSLS
ncbi:MAG: aminoacyl-tRNA hydrolase [Holosporaceae bacterium]|jgi:PTH1 family peptidyl-tRNA hydrolase|nr:aminoacyl-tRNA hydrolase [Holosporaceae bacterium]